MKPEKLIRDISADLKYEATIDLKSGILRMQKADILFQQIPVSITGNVNYSETPMKIDMALSMPETKTANILKSASPFVDTDGVTLSGVLSADIKVSGNIDKVDSLITDGEIRLLQVGAARDNVSAVLDGNIKLSEDSLDIDINGTV